MRDNLKVLSDGCQTKESAPKTFREEPSLMADKSFAGNALVVTLGCSKNLVDSEIMLGALKQKGFRTVTSPEHADVVIVNTCAFLQSAVKEGIDKILELAAYKKTGRLRKLIVAGCMVERYRGDLQKEFPEVDRFVSTDELLTVADDTETSEDCFSGARRPYFIYDEAMPRVRSTSGHSAYVKISEGCDRPCAFCIIPKIRGALRSRPINSVVSEVKHLLSDGVKELNFVAQDLTAYGTDFSESKRSPQLVKLLQDIESETAGKNFWLRLFYAYPIGVTDELMKLIADSKNICSYLDMPLQHISNNVLKAMNRPLGEKGTRALIENMKRVAPDVALRTTFVVGFPGETDADIETLAQFIREGHFSHVGVFTYSQEEEAKSFTFPDQVSEDIREARRDYLMKVQQEVLASKLPAFIGKRERVLIDGFHPETELLLSARTQWQAPEDDSMVIINDLSEHLRDIYGEKLGELPGKFAEVEISEVAGYDLLATLTEVIS